LVGDYQNVEPVDPSGALDPAHVAWTTKDRSAAGHIDNPRVASAAKGEKLLDLFTTDVVNLLQKVISHDGGRGT